MAKISEAVKGHMTANKILKPHGSDFYREKLTVQGKSFYDCMHAQLIRGDWSGKTAVTIINRLHAVSDCFDAYKAIRDDHPEYFFLGNTCDFSHSKKKGEIRCQILYSKKEIEIIRQSLRETIYRIVKGTAYMPLIEKEITVYKRIARSIKYDHLDDTNSHNITGPVLFSTGVCEGYNALLLLCYRRIGISCIKAEGKTTKGDSHCWTIAWINGQPVHCDVTWDRANNGTVWFDYFNLSDRQIFKDHIVFDKSAFPACREENLTYYRYHSLCIGSYSDLRKYLKNVDIKNSPILLHLDYEETGNDYLASVNTALRFAGCMNSWTIRLNPLTKNVMIIGS